MYTHTTIVVITDDSLPTRLNFICSFITDSAVPTRFDDSWPTRLNSWIIRNTHLCFSDQQIKYIDT